MKGDVGDPAFCERAVGEVVDEFARLDVLVNNAGQQYEHQDIEEISPDEIDLTFRTNIYSMFYMSKAALKHMSPGSTIVNTASVTAYKGKPSLLDYSATKGAIIAFTRSLALQQVDKGIRVNAVAPGPIWTPLIPSSFTAEEVAHFGADTPMGRPGQPYEVAPSYVFLASEDGVLQTSSRFYGKASSPFVLGWNLGPKPIDVAEVTRGSAAVLQAAAHVQNTPWILVLEQDKYGSTRLWSAFRANLVAVSLVTALVAALAILAVAKSLADRIRDAEQARESLVKETEHTAKLASIGRLAAGVAHEINNPLAIIAEKAGLVKDMMLFADEMPNRQKFVAQITSVEEAVGRARVITHRLLGFARRMDVPLQAVRVNDVLREVIGFLEKEASYRGIVIALDLDPELPVIESDAGRLQQIFLNILNNAIDAVDRGGRIEITSGIADPYALVVDVKDDGPGMPPDVLEKIFDPFFTTKAGAERHGTGLGLSITYGLVKQLGGRIGVKSAVDGGTVFRVTLPAPPAHARPKHVEASGDA
jgi:signal transduction histidine kinase